MTDYPREAITAVRLCDIEVRVWTRLPDPYGEHGWHGHVEQMVLRCAGSVAYCDRSPAKIAELIAAEPDVAAVEAKWVASGRGVVFYPEWP